jgi:protein TonB
MSSARVLPFVGRPHAPARSARTLRLGAALLGLALLAALVFGMHKVLGGEAPRKPRLQQVAILRQPPPPPPRPAEKLPEPPRIKDEIKLDEPKPKSDEPRPADDKPAADRPLGVDADASAGSDGFGLAANRGGRDITTIGAGTGGGSGRYYTGLLQRNFFEALARNHKAPQSEFSVVVRVWLAEDGQVQRTQIVNGTGSQQLDDLIVTTLAEMAPLREVPPGNLRQVQLRLNRRS